MEASLLLSEDELSVINDSSGGRVESSEDVNTVDSDVVSNLVANPLSVRLNTIGMGLSINVGVESDDSSIINELLEVSNLSILVWALWAQSLDFSLEVSDSLGTAGLHVLLHLGKHV